MKKLLISSLIFLLLLSGCGTLGKDDDNMVKTDEGNEAETFIIPNNTVNDSEYKMMVPFQPSGARETIIKQIVNRSDIHELEDGLRRHSASVFDPEKYIYEEGQYFSSLEVEELVDDLNPNRDKLKSEKDFRKNPRIFSHIVEQNYLTRKDNNVKLSGVSIAISLKSVYRFTVKKDGPEYYEDVSEKEMLAAGKEVADEVIAAVREKEELADVPVMIALYREEKQSSPIPGNYVAKTVVKKDENSIGKWESINEDHILYSSKNNEGKYADDYQRIKTFGERMTEYFPNYVGLIGKGFYQNDELQKTTIEIPIEFRGRSEVIGFTQYLYSLVEEIFKKHDSIEIVVKSMDRTEAIITKKAGSETIDVHVLD